MTKREVCPICGLRVTTLGIELADHLADKHPQQELEGFERAPDKND